MPFASICHSVQGLPSRLAGLLTTLLIIVTVVACTTSSTEVKRIEAAPDVNRTYRDLMIFAVATRDRTREIVEQELVAELKGSGFEARRFSGSNASLAWEDPERLGKDVFAAGAAEGHDGILVVSLERKDRETNYIPEQVIYQPEVTTLGPLASTTYMREVVIPARTEETIEYVLRSTLYDAQSRAPVWRLYSSTVNPDSLESGARDFSQVLVKALNKTLPKGSEI